ncbi:unnamed protein product, partial [marine sediment metagenome]
MLKEPALPGERPKRDVPFGAKRCGAPKRRDGRETSEQRTQCKVEEEYRVERQARVRSTMLGEEAAATPLELDSEPGSLFHCGGAAEVDDLSGWSVEYSPPVRADSFAQVSFFEVYEIL